MKKEIYLKKQKNQKVKDFKKDLINFLKNNIYLKQQESNISIKSKNEDLFIECGTVDGEYERIEININFIA